MALSSLRRRASELDPCSAYPRYFRSIRMDVPNDFPQDMTLHEFYLLRKNHFDHLPLNMNTSEIRLVRIEKSTDDTAPILLTLKHATLNSDLKFTALSYVWGTDASAYPVIIRDSISEGYFLIKRNLWAFFLEARKSTAEWSKEWFWIDQVCIDQPNNKERSHQINQMGLLYSTAQTTILWLTSLHSPPDVPWWYLDATKPLLDPQELEEVLYKRREPTPLSKPRNLSNSAICLVEVFSMRMLSSVVCSSFWRRLWVVQEIVLSSNACVLCDDELWALNDLYEAITIVEANVRRNKSNRWLSVDLGLIRTTPRIAWMLGMQRTYVVDGQEGLGWNDVLYLNYDGECSVPFDRLYAVMGLLHETKRLQPDYTISTDQLLKNLLEKQLTVADTDTNSIQTRLAMTMRYWKEDLRFEVIEPPGWVNLVSVERHQDRPIREINPTIKAIEANNYRLLLRKLGLPDPFKGDSTDYKPDKMDLHTLIEIAIVYQDEPGSRDKALMRLIKLLTLQQCLLSENT